MSFGTNICVKISNLLDTAKELEVGFPIQILDQEIAGVAEAAVIIALTPFPGADR